MPFIPPGVMYRPVTEKGNPGPGVEVIRQGNAIMCKRDDETEWETLFTLSEVTGSNGITPRFMLSGTILQVSIDEGASWINLFDINTIKPADGRSPEFQVNGSSFQVRLKGDTTWATLFSLNDLRGIDGKNVEMQVSGGKVQWRIAGSASWNNLFDVPKDGNSPLPNSLTVGTTTTLAAGSSATVQITGAAPNQIINFGIPRGSDATGTQAEMISGTVGVAGQKVAVTFAKTYSAPPIVDGLTLWVGTQMIVAQASEITRTGCNVTVMQSRGTLLLTSGPFEAAAAGVAFRMLVIGN